MNSRFFASRVMTGRRGGIERGLGDRFSRFVFLFGMLLGQASHGAAIEPTPPIAEVIILSGQSNMAGSGLRVEIPDAWRGVAPNIQFWTGDAFVELDMGETQTRRNGARFGPELGVAWILKTMEPERRVWLVKFARSGQPLHHGWHRNEWEGGDPTPGRLNFYPGEVPDDPNVGRHYADLLQTINAAFAALRADGFEPQLRAVIWMQGEQDAKHEVSAGAYAASLARFKTRLEADLGSEARPLVFGQVLPYEPALPRFTHREAIRQQQAAVDHRSGSPLATPGIWMVPSDGLSLNADTVHFDSRGQAMLGQAMGLTLLAAETAAELAADR